MSMNEVFQRSVYFRVPEPPSPKDTPWYILLGLLNCILFGVGMIILGFLENDVVNMMIGILQLLLPVVGWVWGLIWGILIIVKSLVPSSSRI